MSDKLNNKALAAYLSELSNGDYFIYEIQDFLELFCRGVEQLIVEGKEATLYGFGVFKPKNNAPRLIRSPMGDIDSPGSTTLKFTASETMQTRIKEKTCK